MDNLTINDDLVMTDDGTLTSVTVDVEGDWKFDGLDEDARAVHILLQVRKPGQNWHNAGTTVVGNFSPSKARQGSFSLASDNLLNVLGGSYFEATQDGGTVDKTVEARLIARPIPGKNSDPVNDKLAQGQSQVESFQVTTMNEVAEVAVSGDGNTDAEGVNQGIDYDEHYVNTPRTSNGEFVPRGEMKLFIDESGNRVEFTIVAPEPWTDADLTYQGQGLANVGLGFDADVDGTADFQYAWRSNGDGTGDFEFDESDGSGGWNRDVGLPGAAQVNRDGDTLTVSFPKGHLGGDGSSYKFLVQASAGGEEPAVEISTETGESWQGPNGSWTSSYYFVTETL